MSVSATGGVPTSGAGEEAVELPRSGDAAFGALMDALAPGEETEGAGPAESGAGGGTEPAADGGAGADGGGDEPTGSAAAGDPGTGAEAGAAAPGEGEAGAGAAGGDTGAADGSAEQPAADGGGAAGAAAGAVDASAIVPKLGELSNAFEQNVTQTYQRKAYDAVKEEHGAYFTALEKHPRLLVGTQVPAIGKEGMETLRDTNDAREWQEAVKSILTSEIRDRAQRDLEENGDFLNTVHASIDLFKNNVDLVPGTKTFDRALADRFAEMAKPYELRVEGKLQGYSIPVQPLIDSLRTQLKTERAAKQTKKAAAPTPSTPGASSGSTTEAASRQASTDDPPQAGIASKAGSSDNKEDFATLFGTIGLPNLRI